MLRTIRFFLLFEAAIFIIAALIHYGVFFSGYEHNEARIAESVIAAVLLLGFAVSLARPLWTRAAGLAAQGFALFATGVGVFTIIVGVGPRTVPDVTYHAAIVIVLIYGLVVAARARIFLPPCGRLGRGEDSICLSFVASLLRLDRQSPHAPCSETAPPR